MVREYFSELIEEFVGSSVEIVLNVLAEPCRSAAGHL